jgi:hypothetical protein
MNFSYRASREVIINMKNDVLNDSLFKCSRLAGYWLFGNERHLMFGELSLPFSAARRKVISLLCRAAGNGAVGGNVGGGGVLLFIYK